MDNTLDKRFTFTSLLSFAMPNIIMMISLSMYIIIDGMFVSRLVGTTALSAVNMFYPAICFEMAVAIMLATGGSAIVARKMGEGNQKKAQNNLSFLIAVELLIGISIAIFGNMFASDIISLLGASSTQAPISITYARIIFTFAPAFFLQTAFQTFFVTAGKPTLGLVVTVLAGVTNIALDYIFMARLNMGVAGAAIATGIGYCIPAIAGILFFLTSKNNPLHFVRPKFDIKVLLQSCTNGSSEMVTNLANASTTFLFNYTLLQFYGENGVASITIILYFQYIFTALYFGYSNGIAPIMSYKLGNDDKMQLKSIFKNSVLFLIISSIAANALIHLTIASALTVFTPANSDVYNITLHGFNIYSLAFIIMGFGIFSSSMFTAYSDGKTSAIISFSRTFIFIVGAILILPILFGETGVWIAVPIAETLGFIVSLSILLQRKESFPIFDIRRSRKVRKKIYPTIFIVIIGFVSIMGYARFIEPNLLVTKSFVIETQKPIEPCTMVYFTDTHFGKHYDVSHARKIVEKINEAKPDIVVFGGDLLDNYARDRDSMDLQLLKEELQKIEAKLGKYAVWGNHDYGGGAVRIYEDFMTSCGFEILDDESVALENHGIRLIGYDDYLMGWTDPSLYKIKSDSFNVIISHEPIISQFIESKSENFLLSGHTHGGQVNIPFITNRLLPEGSGEFTKGFYTEKEINTTASLKMYTSSGIGMTRYPFRFLNIPEIIQINFQEGK